MTFRGEVVGGFACAVFAVLWIATALRLPYMGDYAPGSGFLPLWLGVCLLALSAVHIVGTLRRRSRATQDGHRGKVLAVALGLLVCVAVIDELGFVVAAGAYLLFLLRGVEKASWRTSLGVAAITIAILFGLFRLWLKVPLPKGPWGF